ncbi:hypothetical protein QTP81_13600 [Alteromonas sp. ASW11-36]|uniref:STAS/SEC14 domain-containing protein n=1 Tax=Alteromonas arenosi TaxID=3055817 RepID=A0ABT7SZP6_9ALTE|nr:hypothetical protein [Alteromonas sp. ASW11-36]MDM7861630.1 hypothetical protein [Alteromonas sp. ASW11-36]
MSNIFNSSSKFAGHGEYDIKRSGNVLYVNLRGGWNEEAAIAYAKDIEQSIKPLINRPWAIISNLSDWELFTPECFPIISQLVIQAIQSGLCKEAIVSQPNSVKLQPFKLPKDAFPTFQRRFFPGLLEAKSWLMEEGFEFEDSFI